MVNVKFLRDIAKNKIISVTYRKKDGTIAKMACRFHVSKGVKGKGSSYNAEERNYAIVYKMAGKKSGFRTIIVDNIISAKVEGTVYSKQELSVIAVTKSFEEVLAERKKVNNLTTVLTVLTNPQGFIDAYISA